MTDMISAALGLEYGSDEEMRALAQQLRKEKGAADFFSISPTFAKQAAQQQKDILASAERAGLARSKQLDRESAEKRAFAMAAAQAGVDPAMEAYSKKRAEADSAALDDLFSKADIAQGLMNSFDAFQSVMHGLDTGLMSGVYADLNRLGASFGLEIDPDADKLQAARAISNQIALRLRNPESGMGLTGNTSDRDVRFLLAAVPRIQNTEGGNAILLDMWGRIQERALLKAQMAAEYEQKHGRFSKTRFEKEWKEYVDANSLFPDYMEQFGDVNPPEGFTLD